MTAEVLERGPARAPAWVIVSWAITLVVAVAALAFSPPWDPGAEGAGFALASIILAFMFLVPGSMIATRQPRNGLGPTLLLVGTLFAFLALTGGTQPPGAPSDLRLWVTLVTEGTWAPPIFVLLSVVPLIFPDGTLPSRRWRWVIWAAVIGSVLVVVSSPFEPEAVAPLRNPLANKALYDLGGIGAPIGLVAIVLAMVGMVMRYRRARGIERNQLKLFVSAVVVAVSAMVLNGVLIGIVGEAEISPWIEAGLLVFSAAILSIAIGVAILRHKLFDIDVVISKTIVYGSFAVVLTGVYFISIVMVGGLVVGADEGNPVFPVAATAAASLAFQPLRTRAQRLANRLVYGKRASPYEVLSNLSKQLRDTYAGDDVLAHLARSLAEGTGASVARVWIRTGDVLRTAASWPPDLPSRETPASSPTFDEASLVVPVEHGGEDLGALSITKPPNDPLTTTEERLLADVGAQAGLVLRNAGLTAELLERLEQLRLSRERLVKAQDEERRRIERDLHDGAQQILVALKVETGLAMQISSEENVKQMLEQIAAHTAEALDTLRDLARGIYPPLLASDGLPAALRAQAAKATLPVAIDADGLGRYPQEVETAVYFCVLEALQNAAKYSHAEQVRVRLRAEDGALLFTVTDDGRGFDPATAKVGSGTQNMRDRLAVLDGTLSVSSAPAAGTTVAGSVPLAS